jgi:hypothetical protein
MKHTLMDWGMPEVYTYNKKLDIDPIHAHLNSKYKDFEWLALDDI